MASNLLKRAFDIVASATGLILLLPVFAVCSVVIWIRMGWPVFFAQKRPGLNGRPFTLIKFRTMRNAVDRDGQPLSDSERLTKLGRFLRATSLDELPELWNVLRGDMSLVGPRPLLMEYLEHYSPEQMRRHDVSPGLTGWAQINGRNALSWDEKFNLDLWYIDNRTFLLDLKILLLTVKKIISREGISAAGEATMPKFKGSASDLGNSPKR